MVKNTKGGNKSKGFARKFLSSQNSSSIRLPTSPLEQFALVTKMYGTICECSTIDMQSYKCHIRGKFRGRSKRNSIVSVGKIILIGFRDFEAPQFKNTDLLEIYDSHDITSLINIPHLNISSLISLYNNNNNNNNNNFYNDDIDLLFTNNISHTNIIHNTIDTSFHNTNIIDTSIDINTLDTSFHNI